VRVELECDGYPLSDDVGTPKYKFQPEASTESPVAGEGSAECSMPCDDGNRRL